MVFFVTCSEQNLCGTDILWTRCPSCHPTNRVNAPKETQSTDPSQWLGLILSSSIIGLLRKAKRHWYLYVGSPMPIGFSKLPCWLLDTDGTDGLYTSLYLTYSTHNSNFLSKSVRSCKFHNWVLSSLSSQLICLTQRFSHCFPADDLMTS